MSMILIIIIITTFVIHPVFAQDQVVQIPFGAYDPTFETPVENWFEPPIIKINVGDTITWENLDREGHTITSGEGTGRFGWMGGEKFGNSNGFFDSKRFTKGESWSREFKEAGVYSYFCTIHPWMEGAIIVEKIIPEYPYDKDGNKIEKFPIIAYTSDNLIEIDMTWEPNVILTHTKTVLVYQTYDPITNSNLDKMKYSLTIIQNGKNIYQDKKGLTGIGGDFRNVIFEKSGPIEIIFENITSGATSAIQSNARVDPVDIKLRRIVFTTIVYDNPDKIEHHELMVQPARRVELQYEILAAIVLVPGGIFIFTVLYTMYKKPKIKYDSRSAV